MKTSAKILIVAALAVAVIAAVRSTKARRPAKLKPPAPSPPQRLWLPIHRRATRSPQPNCPSCVDLGAAKCIPCKMMAPVLEELKKEYAGRMNVEFIDVWVNPDAGKPYGIEVIPTQIFFDAEGKELFRHVGFFAKEDILAKWKELGVDLAGQSNNGK